MHAVLFDARWIRPRMTGVGMVAYRILLAVPEGARANVGIILPQGSPYASTLKGFRIFFTRIDLTSHPLTDFFEQFGIPWLCYRHGFQAFVSFEGRTPVWHAGFRTYGYAHDTAFLTYWKYNGLKYSILLFAHFFVVRRLATGIITVSRAAKDQLVRIGKARPEKIHVVHNADSGLTSLSPFPSPEPVEKPYFLAVGMTNRRKNLAVLIRAFALFNTGGKYRLVLTGNRTDIDKQIGISGALHLVNLGFVDEPTLRELYRGADALVYPSQDEGFGIPLLDAALFGCPVICSDIPVFHEVMGDDAEYCDPSDPASIAQAMRNTVAAPRIPEAEMFRKKFSWERSAAALLTLCGEPRPSR